MKTLIVSDIHLGSRNSQAGAMLDLLDTSFDRLILNGDTINSLNFKKWKAKHWRVLARLRRLARERELILIGGNHDGDPCSKSEFGPVDVLAHLLGVERQEEFRLPVGLRTYTVLHGDRFDPTLNWPVITDTADWCYRRVGDMNKKMAKWLKRSAKRLGGVINILKRRAVLYAQQLKCQGVITGHTHYSEDEWIDGFHYLNTGCWVDWPCTYVVADDHAVRLCIWGGHELRATHATTKSIMLEPATGAPENNGAGAIGVLTPA